MFGMGGSEILVILIVALLFLGPDKLPEAAKQISKGIRDIKKQSRVLQRTIEDDEHIGGAIRDLKSALRGEDEPVRVTAKTILPAAATTVALPAGPGDPGALAADPDAVEPGAAPDADAPAVAGSDAPLATEAEAPVLRMSPTAGEPDDSAPRSTAADDAELAALVRPAPNTIARSATRPAAAPLPSMSPAAPSAESTLPSDPSEPKHG